MSSLLKSSAVVATGTFMSRLTGLIRVSVFAYVMGQSALTDAYNGANQTPNIVYELLLGGVLSASLVPLFTKQAETRDDDATSAIVSVSLIALTAVTAIAILGAPWIFRLYSFDVADGVDADTYRQAGTLLARIFLLQIFFYGLTAIGNSLLHARRRFFAAAWAPVLADIPLIASLLLVPGIVDGREPALAEVLTNDRLRWTLGLGATLGIAVTALVLIPALRAADVTIEWRPEIRHPAVRKLIRMSAWTFGYVVANQIALVVVQNLAEPGSGKLDAYTKAYLFFVLPHGLLAMSIVTTFAPEMARSIQRRDRAGFIDRASLGARLVLLLAVPAAAGMFVLRRPLIGLALERGNFDATDAARTSAALAGFSLGLIGFSLYLFILRAFYAHEDARTPFVINVFENLINIVVAVVLVGRYGVLGLAASFAIAYTISSVFSLAVLSYKVRGFTMRSVLSPLARMLLAGVVMAEVMWVVARLVGDDEGWGALVRLTTAGVAGVTVYVVLLTVMQVPELQQLRTRLMSRFTTAPAVAADQPD